MELPSACLIVIFSYIGQRNLATADRFLDQYVGCFEYSFSSFSRPMGIGNVLFGVTLEGCRSRCQHHTPSTFFGVMAADTCHCGQQFDGLRRLRDGSCSMRCSYDDRELCGGLLALRIYWVCPIGYYGSQCDRRCSPTCQNHTLLHLGCYLNGTCPGGCQDGWDGPKCDRNLGPMLVLKPPAENSYSPRDGSFAWSCKVVNAAADVDYEVGWYSPNGTEITNTVAGLSNKYVDVENRSAKKLHVLQVSDWVAETYSCRENTAGRLQTKDVSIFVKPFITKFTMTISATVGTRKTFSCEAQGLPRPQYLFYKGLETDTPLQSSNDIVVDGRSGRLTFRSLQLTDEGYYTCKAFSDIGYATTNERMLVFADTVSGKTIATILLCIAGAVMLVIVISVCRNRQHKNRQKSLQSTVPQPAPSSTSPGRVDEASAFANCNDRPMSRDDETRVDVMPAINPDFAVAERPTEETGLIPSAPDVEPPSYEELFGGTRNKITDN